jgi:CubicO group peptidase (beta-lactamase class C family)
VESLVSTRDALLSVRLPSLSVVALSIANHSYRHYMTGFLTLNSCTEVIAGLRDLHPVAPVNSRPVYSQLTFTIFTYVLEKEFGLDYSELLDKFIINPLGMSNSGPSPGNDDVAVIPPGDQIGWGTDYGINAPYVMCPKLIVI